MDSHELDGDTSFLTNLVKCSNPSKEFIEHDLQVTLDAIHRQVEIGTTLLTQWTYIKNDKCYLSSSPAEQLLIINRNLRAAVITKERILRLATRYILTDKLYDNRAHTGRLSLFERQDWLEADREKNRTSASSVGFRERCSDGDERSYKRSGATTGTSGAAFFFFTNQAEEGAPTTSSCNSSNELIEVKNKLKAQAEELEQLKKTLVDLTTAKRFEERESDANKDKFDAAVQPSTDQKTAQEFVQEVQEQIQERVQEQEPQVDDCDYFERMVEEVQDDEVDMAADEDVDSRRQSPVPPYDDEGPSSVKAELPSTWNAGSTSMELRQRIALLEEAREQLPFGTFGASSRGVEERVTCSFCSLTGVHCSDSCPNVRDGNERFEIVMRSDLCKYCLERCPYEVCKYRYRDCWYCARVRGTTIEDLIPRDGGHHRALCNIPDAKPIIRRRIAAAWKELEKWNALG
ncbi:hypothetical protein ANCDUO_00725 [Ancylostoma duodenale]|uniref:Uncharacterized protein n=1 Tax=Ancylostoma duodenale TaxID=51022 RepID=A0A0C2DG45_9BILA|nr:hypothetical protein ANCDUO_00725 [Ancylostoma duodenale]